jgi:signal transduction histidine kinase
VLALGLLLTAFTLAFRHSQLSQAEREIERSAWEVQNLLRLEQEQHSATMRTMLEAVMRDESLAEAFAARDREALLARAKPLFDSLNREHEITHFYFHAPDRINLLRVHRPQQSGDTINRATILESERTGQITSGLERGPIGTFVLRVVSPWHHEGRFLGYLELGVEFEDMIRPVHGLLKVDFVVAVYKEFLDRAQWDRALKTYGREASWDQFPTTVVIDKTLASIPPPITAYLSDIRPEIRGTNRIVPWNDRRLLLVFLPLTDLSGKTLGELIVVRDITVAFAQARSAVHIVTLTCLGVGAFLAGLFYLFLTRIEQNLAAKTESLRREILERQHAEEELRAAREDLEQRVTERTRDLETTHRQLLEISRQAGMAEVATSVLHNVGNVLNSVNVSATLVSDVVRRSKAPNLAKLRDLLDEHRDQLARFIAEDPRGRVVPSYIASLADSLAVEQRHILAELDALRKNIDHIKDIVAMQQSYAKTSGVVETFPVSELVEDSLRMNIGSLARHDVAIVRDYQVDLPVTVDKNKVLQILVNLIRNAKYACDESGRTDKSVTLRTTSDGREVSIAVIDNGVGISAENLTKIFAHGFTTRKHGHGFGLHSGAIAAKELGGSLNASSDGTGKGATFELRIPIV